MTISRKKFSEVAYLNETNTPRYRAILRFLYEKHQRLQYWLGPDEIFAHLIQDPFFADYTPELLQQDLNQLEQWKNLVHRQDTAKVLTVEDFKKKKFQYRCTPYTIEIERLIEQLEGIQGYGGSLESNLFERIAKSLSQLVSADQNSSLQPEPGFRYPIEYESDVELWQWWQDLYDDFKKLTDKAVDYLASLQSEKVEAAMKTVAFLASKEVFTEYLRSFMRALQRSSLQIESVLDKVPDELLVRVFQRLAQYQHQIPRFDQPLTLDEIYERLTGQWQGIYRWFLGSEWDVGEIQHLQAETNNAIRKITRYVQRIGERQLASRSRKADYLYLAKWFASLESVEEAHRLSACVFGVPHTRHLFADSTKKTEDIYTQVWEDEPSVVTCKPRTKEFKERRKPNPIPSQEREKRKVMEEYLRQKAAEQQLINKYIINNRIALAELPVVEPFVRKTLLGWIGKAMADRSLEGKTEDGRKYMLIPPGAGRRIVLRCEDGDLEMPDYIILFRE